MLRFIAKRLLLALPTLWAVLTLVFLLVRVVPGDPTIIVLGDQASPAAREALRQRLGLDKPLLVQYGEFMVQIAQGDLGRSLVTNRPISTDVAAVLPYTIELTLAALFIGSIIGVPLGVVAAQRRDGFVDWLARIVSLAGLSFPAFVSGILLLIAFAVELRWFPVISTVNTSDPLERLRALALPAINLGLIMVAYVTRVTRSGMLKALSEDYVRTARAKGLPSRLVVWRHALRNVLIPVVTVVGLYLGVLIGNAVLTEIVFNRPGLGKLIVVGAEPARLRAAAGPDGGDRARDRRRQHPDRPDLRARRSAGEDRMSAVASAPAAPVAIAAPSAWKRATRSGGLVIGIVLVIAMVLIAIWRLGSRPSIPTTRTCYEARAAVRGAPVRHRRLRPRRALARASGAPASRSSSARSRRSPASSSAR